jgi:hypothetical protein
VLPRCSIGLCTLLFGIRVRFRVSYLGRTRGKLGRMSIDNHVFVEWRGGPCGRSDSGSS